MEKSFQDESINKVLSKLGSTFDQTIHELSKAKITTKFGGEIVDISISYNVPFETLSPSLKKLINKYKKENDEKRSYIKDTLNELSKEDLERLALEIRKQMEKAQ
jgi:hypothetical protein